MIPQPPPGQGPIDPQRAFPGGSVPPPNDPWSAAGPAQPSGPQGGLQFPQQFPQVMPSVVPPMMPNMPPMQMMPPMMPFPYPPPPPPRRGGARAFFMGFLVLMLVGSALLNLLLLVGSLGGGTAGALQHTLQAGGADKVAVVPLKGIIDGSTSVQFDRFMDTAEADKSVKALVIEIDTPGGTVTASDEIYNRIKQFKAKKPIPIVVSMGSLATSGGYYAACGGDHVFAQPTTFTGNIGVLMPRYNFSKLMDKYGVEETTIVSSGATYKNAGSSFRPETPDEKKYMQGLADSAFAQFKNVVTQGRSAKLKAKLEDVANGKVFTAADALTMGLIDQVGYLDDAQAHATKAAGLTGPTIVRYQDPPTFMQLLMASKSAVPALSAGGNAPGVSITIDQRLLHEMSTPRPLYLWRGQ